MPETLMDCQPLIADQPAIVLVCAGRGQRAGEGLPKQYRLLAGEPVVRRTLKALRAALPLAYIQPVIHPDDAELFASAAQGIDGILVPAPGGATRQASVLAGLAALEALSPALVLVHDAARPFVTTGLVNGVLTALQNGAAAVVPGVAIVDSIRRDAKGGTAPVDRSGLYRVQTPQGFTFADLLSAHRAVAGEDLSDDATVMERAGHAVAISGGDANNIKLTLAEDFVLAEKQIISALADVRTGTGFDVHRFEPGDHVWLCGIKVPFTQKLKGHSDADVGLHALTDAILMALADGDIGFHFPPTEAKWKGVSSDTFLTFARDRVLARGGMIANVGVTIICEAPKLMPWKAAMQERVAELLQIATDRVSIQATTTEKLGFTGRGEGIAAQAVATVRLP
ncbi:bifunctional 2-C-methyl-D-erythritol 4-phosphate cytidylyltransferase/2-C-methyl-D-erythritol 2,4-cyclodiphosphate synthase [Gimibacter soli]|uniref:Bifunctional enzyme IspD/IspF n=1 Tax=Gimibacter soli TaxID=3024400 RepID=A0AAF0BFW4_9PROT|nr:bifunctional 2-C-methyl-D-erythritol 4-phosphate cytidylyltransferase/2-C-methyl-D-erythritol 2,4-cyclodiphosphate synthase [Gimibacter soli]WCL52933.1 bifunctional 2-C-methyl-D-erythritol 4-phosphate cytidylyltransferase/2-C-methyl-D-erythritol 2,4-cyclodiphosphate synthase [Gimibacter soli]